MNDAPLRSIVIAGGGATGWAAAAALAQELKGQPVSIRLVEAPDARVGPMATPALPSCLAFHERIGLAEPDVVRSTGATFRLGTRFLDWGRPGEDEIHPIAAHGASVEYLPFHQFANRVRLEGDPTPYEAYSLSVAAARAGRFAPPADDPGSVFSTLAYSLNLDLECYAALLRVHALRLGVDRVPGRIRSVAVAPGDGFIRALELDGGETIEGDLFLDCTGSSSRLLGEALEVPYEDWSELLPGNRAARVLAPVVGDLPTCVTVVGHEHGWQRVVPLQHGTHETFVYDDRVTGDDDVLSRWPQDLRQEVRIDRLRPGRRRVFWQRNCVALGAAAGRFQPVDGAGLSIVHTGVTRLLGLLPLRDCSPLLAEEYNRLTGLEYQNLRDFHALHYQLSGRAGQGFWQVPGPGARPATLDHRMNLFRCHGQVALHEEETHSESNWAAAWIGHGAWPEGYEPMLDGYDLARLKQRFDRMREFIAQGVGRMPSQARFIATNDLAGPR